MHNSTYFMHCCWQQHPYMSVHSHSPPTKTLADQIGKGIISFQGTLAKIANLNKINLHQCHLCAINCVAGQILYRSNRICQFAIKGKMEMKDGRKYRRMGVKDRGNDVAMEVERQRLLEGNDKAD